jgi:hypothetical protein
MVNENCLNCNGTGKVYNNGDDTCGQYYDCECTEINDLISKLKVDYPTASGCEICGSDVFILNKKGKELAKISLEELESYQ